MNKYMRLAAISISAFLALSCKSVDIKDGRIPAEYLEQAKALVGTYVGQMNYQPVQLDVSLDGDYFSVKATPDLLSAACQSHIGDLKKVWVEQKDDVVTVTDARFDFDPNFCSVNVMGESLEVKIKQRNGRIELQGSVLEYTEWRKECHVECVGNPPRCYENCRQEPYYHYLNGKFTKQ